jgi:hypothetical protein
MARDVAWYVLIWVAPAAPSEAAFFVHEGPFATREAAIIAAQTAREVPQEDRFLRVIESAEPPTGDAWDDAEEIDP